MTVAARSRVSVRLLVNGLVLAFAVASISMAALERIVPLTGHQTLVIAGPSGAGKGTIVSRLKEREPTLRWSVSWGW